jgi:hypothetical protein
LAAKGVETPSEDDILWQRADGLVYVWLMDGASIIGAGGLSGVDSNWGII